MAAPRVLKSAMRTIVEGGGESAQIFCGDDGKKGRVVPEVGLAHRRRRRLCGIRRGRASLQRAGGFEPSAALRIHPGGNYRKAATAAIPYVERAPEKRGLGSLGPYCYRTLPSLTANTFVKLAA